MSTSTHELLERLEHDVARSHDPETLELYAIALELGAIARVLALHLSERLDELVDDYEKEAIA